MRRRYPIFGTGVETFAYSYYETRPVGHNYVSEWNFLYNKAHNEYLNFAATTGSVGLSSYLILIVVSVFVFIKNKRADLLAGYAAIGLTNFFGFSVVVVSLLFFFVPCYGGV